MTADTFKMGTLIGLIFCTLIMSGKIMAVESTVYSSPDSALKFSQCLIEKMRESPFFTLDDQNSMFELQDVMAQGLLKKEHSLFGAKVLVTAFVTSLANIVFDDGYDASRNTYRKVIYSSALEQCGYGDAEFVDEAQKLLSFIEMNKARDYEETSAVGTGMSAVQNFGSVGYSQASGVNSPFAVQPSPVQNPPPPQYSAHKDDKTIFDQREIPYYPPIASTAQIVPNPQYPANPSSQVHLASSFGTGFKVQSRNAPQVSDFSSISETGSYSSSFASNSQYENFPIVSDISETSKSEKGFLSPHAEKNPYGYDTGKLLQIGGSEIPQSGLGSHTGSVPYVYDTGGIPKAKNRGSDVLAYAGSLQTGPINEGSTFGGLSIPQTKESSVVVIPPIINQQPLSDEHFFQNPENDADKVIYLPSNRESADIPQAYGQPSDYTELQSFVMNILTTSPKFRKAFNSEISQENAINLARALTEQTFSGYNFDVMNDALSVVTEEVYKVRVPSPETFAFALSNALVSVLKRHDSSLSTGQSQLATSFLSSLDNSGQFNSHQEIVEKQQEDYNTGVTLEQSGLDNSDTTYSETETVGKDYEGQNTDVPLDQLYPQEEIVEEESQDDQIDEEFYSEYSEKKTDFDFQSPPLSPEDRKDEMFSISLSRCLSKSDAIRNFFCNHNEPDDVVQISFSIIKASLTEYGIHVAPIAASVASGALSELSKEELCNNFARTISEIIAEILEESGIKDANPESIASKMEQNLIQRQITPTESQKPPTASQNFPPKVPETETAAVPNLQSSFTSVEEIIPHQQAKTDYQDKMLPFDYKDALDYKYTPPMTLLHTSPSSSTVQPNVHSSDWGTDDVEKKKTLVDILFEKFHTLASFDSKKSADNYKNAEETSSTTKIVENQESGEEFDEESSTEEFSQKPHIGRKKKYRIITPEPDIGTTCSDEDYEEYEEDYNPTATGGEEYEEVYKPTTTEDEEYEDDYNPTITEDAEYEEIYDPTTAENEDEILDHQGEGENLQKEVDHADSTDSDVKITSVKLQPGFQNPASDAEYSSANFQPKSEVKPFDSDYSDSSLALARQISKIAQDSSTYIRSEKFYMNNLCVQINQLAPLVNIPTLHYCEPVAAVDYLLNVLRAAIKILKGEKK